MRKKEGQPPAGLLPRYPEQFETRGPIGTTLRLRPSGQPATPDWQGDRNLPPRLDGRVSLTRRPLYV